MIKQYPLFFEPTLKIIYYVGSCFCDKCNVEIQKRGTLYKSWSKKNSLTQLLCDKCSTYKKQDVGIVKEKVCFIIVPSIPDNCYPYLITSPDITQGNIRDNVFSMADDCRNGEVVIDHTVLSGRESWEGCTIGCEVKDDGKDLLLSDNSFEREFLQNANSEPHKPDKPLLK